MIKAGRTQEAREELEHRVAAEGDAPQKTEARELLKHLGYAAHDASRGFRGGVRFGAQLGF
ncbi:MAG: hypothetical protein ACRERV_03375 [Methylococcales bacterium]